MGQRRPAGGRATSSLQGYGAPMGQQPLQLHPPLIEQKAIGGRLLRRPQGAPRAGTHAGRSAGEWSQSQPGGLGSGGPAGPQKGHGEMQIGRMKAP
jgi:hypothetical protein